MKLSILYRGSLVSCNYGCDYCPFAKRRETRAEAERDRLEVERFVLWAASRPDLTLSILFTPWGEALVRPWYREAMVRLSNLPHVEKVAAQTNLSVDAAWTEDADKTSLALWATYHPTQVSRERFLARCHDLRSRGVRASVGIVGLRENLDEAEALRAALPEDTYVWVNAYKRDPEYYSAQDLERIEAIDPLFGWNNQRHPSEGQPCRAGETVISVDGEGTIRRCHFIPEPIGNLYAEGGLEVALRPRLCTNATCGCYIGYVHLEALDLYEVYAGGVLERIPVSGLPRRPPGRRLEPLARIWVDATGLAADTRPPTERTP